VTGSTASTDFPTRNALQPAFGDDGFGGDAFVAKLSAEGATLVYSTYLGGSDFDQGFSIAVDGKGDAYVTGKDPFDRFPNPERPTMGQSGLNGKIRDAVLVNTLVSFMPLEDTFQFVPDTAGCPTGFVGKFLFGAHLTNTGDRTLSDLWVQVAELTQDNRLLTSQGLIGEVASFEVPPQDGFADGQLSPEEQVDVPFTVCLAERTPFHLLVNIWEAQ
jgi:hypothetical protein